MITTKSRLSLDGFLRLPEEKPALEYEEGTVGQKVSPKGKHSILQTTLAQLVNAWAAPGKRAFAFTELRITLASRSYVPDISVFRWDRIARDASGQVADDFPNPPDLAVEIVSPEQSVTALVRRCLWCVANGIQVALLVDAGDESIILFRANQPALALRETDRIDLDDILPGFDLTAQAAFAGLTMS